ncbi:hydroxymethylglutaryl-CoA synthase family protein [Novosphingobium pentaromativorans]|uniref:3-hydroxy-3-methylglutaryl CoA synthase n=1 Tax=Novosphingobium pentaromativorans US6-1 TaxID=1088721 RepID=G6ED70_9SPHN|nr:OB-fold domain-containing protein [Novosphingobium pentaromativorans]AIT79836.1 3-hydroxy-3-methylglutaryl CoA synthase [Novosphingobium pentaromativorans US6-1]EHJ60782.1 protein of unknown function DUF35 [Novosphingobium pentaromativorans US6-1]
MAGIQSFGAYVPRLRLQRAAVHAANKWFAPGLGRLAKGERSMVNWDEDVVTMAVEAARDCLADRSREDIATVMLASSSAPFADRQNSGILKEALNLSDHVATIDIGMSQKAGAGALLQACRSASSGTVLVTASESRRARPASEDELLNGDGAAAFVIGEGDGLARLVDSYSVSADFVDHFRPEGEEFDTGWEARWVRDEGYSKLAGNAISGLLKQSGVDASAISKLIVGIPGKGIAAGLAKRAGIAAEAVADDLGAVMGSAGTAHPLVMLAHSLETAKPGDLLLVLGFGQGADVLLFEATDAIGSVRPLLGASGWLERGRQEPNYMKYLSFAGHIQLELGKRAEFDQSPVLTALYRNRKTVLGLVGGRCTETGTIQFPKTDISVNQNNPAIGTQEDYPLAEVPARVMSYTSDSLTFTLDPPNYYGMIDFEGGGRMLTEFTDVDPGQVAVGAPMRMMFRVKSRDNRSGFVQYFWKAVPTVGSDKNG